MPGHHAVYVGSQKEAHRLLSQIGVDAGAYPFLVPKGVYRCIKLKTIPCRAAIIIKQEMLSKGGEAAVSRDTLYGEGVTDVLLMGTLKHYRLLLKKLQVQPFGLRHLAAEIQGILDNLEPGRRSIELCHGRSLDLGQDTLIMGILNVTPDSFSDGGRFMDTNSAVNQALQMKEEGVDLIDIGGASSRPNSLMIDEEQELRRIMPVVERLAREDLILSVDTFRSGVARRALEAGAHLINDIGSLKLDKTLLPMLVQKQAPVILMHNRLQINHGQPYDDILAEITGELQASVNQAVEAGLPPDKIMIDPGIGFGKTPGQNRFLIGNLQSFKGLGRPIVLGASRKGFIGETLGLDVSERLEGSLAVLALGILNGADIIRVHDVKESKRVARMIDAVRHENG